MLTDAVAHATLPVSDLERARRFYAEKLGLTPSMESPGGLFFEPPGGGCFLLFPTSGRPSGEHTQMGWAVSDIEAEVGELRSRGVAFEEYDVPGLKTVNGIAQAGAIRSAWFQDSEGNLLGIVQLP